VATGAATSTRLIAGEASLSSVTIAEDNKVLHLINPTNPTTNNRTDRNTMAIFKPST
jgi:hypothetical protein